jgi:putative flippase GtrA
MKTIRRFSKYALTGFGTFLFDLAFLYILIDIFSVFYITASAISFLTATSINYCLIRKYVFHNSQTNHTKGYLFFAGTSTIGLVVVTIGMIFSVEYLELHYILARAIAVSVVFLINYNINLHFNFKVAGKHD